MIETHMGMYNFVGGSVIGRTDPGNDWDGEDCFFISGDVDDVGTKNWTGENKNEFVTEAVGVILD